MSATQYHPDPSYPIGSTEPETVLIPPISIARGAPDGDLPATGWANTAMLVVALLLVVFGLLALAARKRLARR